jgi:hypothetical protein
MIDTTMAALAKMPVEQWDAVAKWAVGAYFMGVVVLCAVVVHGIWSDAKERERREQRVKRF